MFKRLSINFISLCAVTSMLFLSGAIAEEPVKLTLEMAQSEAIKNSPTLQAASAEVGATEKFVAEKRADYFPQISADATSVKNDEAGTAVDRNGVEQHLSSYITAGALNTSTLMDRNAAGIQVKQLVTDFGRTSELVNSAKASNQASIEKMNAVRNKVVLDVTSAYYRSLQSQATVKIAEKTLQDRQLELEKITLLAKNKLKSELDVGFASVALEQGKVLLLQAQNDYEASMTQLAFAMGYKKGDIRQLSLADVDGVQQPPPTDIEPLLTQAMNTRPDLLQLRFTFDQLNSYADAQKALSYPSLNVLAAAGKTFSGDARLPDRYAAVGLNISMPLFAGGKYTAKQGQAEYKASAALDELIDFQNVVAKDVRVAWLNSNAGFQALSASQRLRSYAEKSLELAQSRYNLGLSSIVELNTAELNALDAEIQEIKARYNYRINLANLSYQTGTL